MRRGRAELAEVRLRRLGRVVEPLADFGGRESCRRQFGDPVGAGDRGLAGGGIRGVTPAGLEGLAQGLSLFPLGGGTAGRGLWVGRWGWRPLLFVLAAAGAVPGHLQPDQADHLERQPPHRPPADAHPAALAAVKTAAAAGGGEQAGVGQGSQGPLDPRGRQSGAIRDPGDAQAQPVVTPGNGDGQGGDVGVGQQQHQHTGDRFAPLTALLAPVVPAVDGLSAVPGGRIADFSHFPRPSALALALAQRIPARLVGGGIVAFELGHSLADHGRAGGVGVFGQIQQVKARRTGHMATAVAKGEGGRPMRRRRRIAPGRRGRSGGAR
jgi:hypothetical protein